MSYKGQVYYHLLTSKLHRQPYGKTMFALREKVLNKTDIRAMASSA